MFTSTEISNITANVESLIVDELVEQFLERKKESLLLSDSFRRLGLHDKAHRVHECGSWLQYRVHLDRLNDPRCQRLTGANFCGHFLCCCCQWRKSRKLKNQLVAIMNHLNSYRYLFLTLTCKNVYDDELNATVDNLLSTAWHRFVNNRRFKKSIKGYFRVFEVTHDVDKIITHSMYKRKRKFYKRHNLKVGDKNPTYDTYHPHIHVLLAVEPSYFDKDNDSFIQQKEWRQMWAKALLVDYDPYVDIRAVYDKQGGEKRKKRDLTPVSAILEAGKYIAKSNDYIIRNVDKSVDMERTDLAVKALLCLSGRHTISFGGVFRQAKKELQLVNDDDLVHTETNINHVSSDFIEYNCSWTGRRKGSSGGYKINSEYAKIEERGEVYDNIDN
jgi:plasmid rolling circle replication initiator protein Rep